MSLLKVFKKFVKDEKITFWKCFNPKFVFSLFLKYNYFHYLLVGLLGLLLNLFLIWFLTEFIFGLEKYFVSYLIGYFVNLVFNFVLNVKVVFVGSRFSVLKFLSYVMYSLSLLVIQSFLIKAFVTFFGVEFYLPIIFVVMFATSIVGFVFLKLFLFKREK
ncbi:MAG: GtrA family protein [Nanoarchaeota archaeon]|nr:GtrA family protein [Nanoarchaeota archaeon]